ncbi:hypothetical protein BVI1335_40012 [Burkholderia vietnamiensis]|nr:hypothetical protein BVI1335_40012 [Burkholderia vietnamiensis]
MARLAATRPDFATACRRDAAIAARDAKVWCGFRKDAMCAPLRRLQEHDASAEGERAGRPTDRGMKKARRRASARPARRSSD